MPPIPKVGPRVRQQGDAGKGKPSFVLAPPAAGASLSDWILFGVSCCRPWVVSISVHLIVVLLFSGVALQTVQQQVVELAAESTAAEHDIVSFEYEIQSEDFAASTAPAQAGRVELQQMESIEPPVYQNEMTQVEVADMFAAVSSLGVMGDDSSNSAAGQAGDGAGSGTGGESTGTNFYGVSSTGKSIVYVLDTSGSMTGIRWGQAREELARSINQLGEQHQFMVLLYNTRPNIMLNLRGDDFQFLDATEENKKRVIKWLYRQMPDGSTMPLSSIKLALRLNPDSIFLLSDGIFQDNTVGYLSQIEQKPVINTIAYKSPLGAPLLQRIALDCNGQFLQVH